MKVPKLNNEQIEFFVNIAIASAIATLDANLEESQDYTQKELDQFIDSAITQVAYNLSILYAQIKGEGMGCSDAVGTEFLKSKDLDEVLRTFANKKIQDKDAQRPDDAFLAKHWTNFFFKTPEPIPTDHHDSRWNDRLNR